MVLGHHFAYFWGPGTVSCGTVAEPFKLRSSTRIWGPRIEAHTAENLSPHIQRPLQKGSLQLVDLKYTILYYTIPYKNILHYTIPHYIPY